MRRGITGNFQQALKDWTSITYGTISHYEHNFHLFFEKKSTASIICTFWYNFAVQKLSFIEHATNVFGPRSVLQANLSNEIIYLSVVTWGGVCVLVVYCLSFYSCQTMY